MCLRPLTCLAAILFVPIALDARFAASAADSAGSPGLFERLDADQNGELSASEVPSEHQRLFARLLRKADQDQSGTLSASEFEAGLMPTRPAKAVVEKANPGYPGADAAQLFLLKMDVNRDAQIDADEVPIELAGLFDQLTEQLDRNDDDRLVRQELTRGGRQLARIAQRYARARRIDVPAELARVRRQQVDAAKRFEEPPRPARMLTDANQVGQLFKRWDANNDGQLTLEEIPERIRPRMERLFRTADRNADGQLSQREFAVGAGRAGRIIERLQNAQ